MDTSSGKLLGRYLLGEKLATGGMGEVFVAVKKGRDSGHPLALKVLLPHLVEEAAVVKMFMAEAQLSSGMNHPNIIRILDLGKEQGRYFLVMELVRGVSLVDLVRVLAQKQQALSAPVILHVARGMLDALHYAHTLPGKDGKPLGLIHRDVTPHNLLVSVTGEVKLSDFGIAKVQAVVGQTRPGVVRGKMDYLSPEQLRFERLDSRVDLFAAGLTLFFLATGRSAFFRTSTHETLKAIQNDPLPFLDTLRPDLPRALVEAISRSTQKDPSLRFATARAFREALPPPTAEERAEVLGALVSEVCPGAVKTIEHAVRALVSPGGSDSKARAGTSSRSSQPVETVQGTASTKASALKGTVPAPVMLEQEPPRPDVATYVPPPVALRHDSTVMLAAPAPWSRKRRWTLVAAVGAGVGALTALGLGVWWWLSRSG